MKKIISAFLLSGALSCFADYSKTIIPQPNKLEFTQGELVLNPSKITYTGGKEFYKEVQKFASRLGGKAKIVGKNGVIQITKNGKISKEGYNLTITGSKILVEASDAAGVYYALQSVTQMLPAEVSVGKATNKKLSLPALKISDAPRFSWRSYMLDESRYFFGKEVVKEILDQMAIMKMNVFHWHLTDDQGWRIEIKKYPKLTTVGSIRKDSQVGGWGSSGRSGEPHSGFYTQDDIREIVKYAAARHITIVPEIGMPGHASAAIAAYPELGSSEPLKEIEVPVIYGKMPDTFNPANEFTYKFLSDVLDEVCALFPSKIIHIGGDEVRMDQWHANSKVKALMERENLKTMADVQIYFTNRMSQIIESKGRNMMGWNEIMGDDLHGILGAGQAASGAAKLSKNAVVQFWKGSAELAKRAIMQGHDVVNSWHSFTYLDYSYGNIPLRRSYDFNPIFSGLDAQYHSKVKGFGCQMWTEWTSNREKMFAMTFPRLAAYAEVGWTNESQKNWDNFRVRMNHMGEIWDLSGIKYAKDQIAAVTREDFFNYVKVGEWTPKQTTANWSEQLFPVKLEGKGEITLALVYSKGSNAIDIAQVVLLENGKEVAKDVHEGFSGNSLSNMTYKLDLKKFNNKAKYEFKVRMKGSAGTDSYGELKIQTQ